jgi:hypothetical protein
MRSNYFSPDIMSMYPNLMDGVDPISLQKKYKSVVIIGREHRKKYISDILKLQEKYGDEMLVIGDGKRDVTDKDLLQLEGKIDQNTRIEVMAHGNVDRQGKHFVSIDGRTNTEVLFARLKGIYDRDILNYQTNMHVELWSCHGGAAVISLPKNTTAILHAPKNHVTYMNRGGGRQARAIRHHFTNPDPRESFRYGLDHPETSVYAQSDSFGTVMSFRASAPKTKYGLRDPRGHVAQNIVDFNASFDPKDTRTEYQIKKSLKKTVNVREYAKGALRVAFTRGKPDRVFGYNKLNAKDIYGMVCSLYRGGGSDIGVVQEFVNNCSKNNRELHNNTVVLTSILVGIGKLDVAKEVVVKAPMQVKKFDLIPSRRPNNMQYDWQQESAIQKKNNADLKALTKEVKAKLKQNGVKYSSRKFEAALRSEVVKYCYANNTSVFNIKSNMLALVASYSKDMKALPGDRGELAEFVRKCLDVDSYMASLQSGLAPAPVGSVSESFVGASRPAPLYSFSVTPSDHEEPPVIRRSEVLANPANAQTDQGRENWAETLEVEFGSRAPATSRRGSFAEMARHSAESFLSRIGRQGRQL